MPGIYRFREAFSELGTAYAMYVAVLPIFVPVNVPGAPYAPWIRLWAATLRVYAHKLSPSTPPRFAGQLPVFYCSTYVSR